MTVPPHQPGLYGPPPPGQHPHSDPAPQQGGPYGPYPPPGPPKKNRTALWIGLGSTAILAVLALMVTGLVAPGFLTTEPQPRMTAEAFVDQFVSALNTQDLDTATGMSCHNDSEVETALRGSWLATAETVNLRVVGVHYSSGGGWSEFHGTINGENVKVGIFIDDGTNRGYCVGSIHLPKISGD